jgi:hypothetical protein
MKASMQDEKDNINKLDRMLKQAASEKPVMSLDDVQNLISVPRATPPKKNLWLASAILLLSVGGIVLSVILSDKETKVVPESKNSVTNLPQQAATPPENSLETTALSKTTSPEIPETPEASKPEASSIKTTRSASVTTPEVKASPTQLTHYKAYTYYFNKPDHRIEITVIDGKVTELSDNGEIKQPEEYNKYEAMIESAMMKATIDAQKTTSDDKKEKERYLEWKQQLTTSLLNDQLIDDPDKYEFSFDNNSLIVNGIKQDDALFQKYKLRYEEVTGKIIHSGTSLTIRKQ